MAIFTSNKTLQKMRNHPVKEMVLRQLVDAAMGLCEPENADEAASNYSRMTLYKKFSAILYPNYKPFR